MRLTLPWPPRALSPNARVHYMAVSRAKKVYRTACSWTARQQGAIDIGGAEVLFIGLEFVPPTRRHHDVDNCVASAKALIDGLADALGVDDRIFRLSPSPRIAEGEIGGFVRVTVSRLVDMLHGDVDLETELPAPQGLQLDAQAK